MLPMMDPDSFGQWASEGPGPEPIKFWLEEEDPEATARIEELKKKQRQREKELAEKRRATPPSGEQPAPRSPR